MDTAEDLEFVECTAYGQIASIRKIPHGLSDDGLLGDGVLENLPGNRVVTLRERDEIRLDPAGGDLEDMDPLGCQFPAESVAIRTHERFACRVHVQLLQRQIGRCGTDFDDVRSGRHARDAQVGDLHQGGDVEPDHRSRIGDGHLPRIPETTDAGAVDEVTDLRILRLEDRCEGIDPLRSREVDGECFARRFQDGCQLKEPVFPASDHPDGIETGVVERPAEFGTHAGGGAGDHGYGHQSPAMAAAAAVTATTIMMPTIPYARIFFLTSVFMQGHLTTRI